MAANDCIDAVRNAAKGKLTDDEILSVFEAVDRKRKRLVAEGKLDGLSERLVEAAKEEGDKVRILAAMQRKHAALNAIARDRIETHISNLVKAGMKPDQAILSLIEGAGGTRSGIAGGRVSAATTKLSYERRFMGRMLADIQAEKPHIVALLNDEKFNDDIVREMVELREGGKPGKTGNADAQFAARVFAKHAEVSRTELNRLGAMIGKLDGWAGPQAHDPIKLIKASEEAWIKAVLPKLDVARSFPDIADDPDALRKTLHNVYENITTGRDREVGPREKGEFVGPANLAKKLGEHRVLHFKNADAWIEYRNEFGYGNVFSAMMHHQRRAAAIAGQMEVFGPNPAVMLGSVIDAHGVDAGNMGAQGGSIQNAYMEMSGLTAAPHATRLTAARIGTAIRAHAAGAKLGGAVLTSLPTDTAMAGLAGMFRGSGFWNTFTHQVGMTLKGRPKGEQAEIGYLLGEGYDGLIAHVMEPFHAQDAPVGWATKVAQQVFRWSGFTWATDVSRSVAGRMIAAELGMHASKPHATLPKRFQHVLGLHGIGEKQWEAIRTLGFRAENGNVYITPDRAEGLSDAAIAPLVNDRLALLPAKKRTPEVIARYQADARRDIEMALGRYVADETNYSIIEHDPRSRRFTLQGTRPGTTIGELARMVTLFKGFPIAFTDRVLGRAFFGAEGSNWKERMTNNLPHIGALIAGLTLAGYASMTAKDVARGYWPPREPDAKTLLAAMKQGGGAGIYGDFLFGEASRFSHSVAETAAGPVLGDVGRAISILQGLTQGEKRSSQMLNLVVGNTPFVNLWYARAAVDTLFLNSMRETLSPGYLHRQEERRRKEYGQQSFIPRTVGAF